MPKWSLSDLPSQQNRIIVVTGTGGLGFEDALALSRRGGTVILAGRNPEKGAEAVAKIKKSSPGAQVRFEILDLASLRSVADFGTRMKNQVERIDVLINNAAVMAPPKRQVTTDGFELQFGTNYLGHFALTAHLYPLLRKGQNTRVVTVSSLANRDGKINFEDLQAEQKYQAIPSYAQSKLANLLFAFELHRRSEREGWGIMSNAAHPGLSRTDLLPNGMGRTSPVVIIGRYLLGYLALQPPERGALPTLYAATSPDAVGGAYYGPDKLGETRGFPTFAKIPPQGEDKEVAERLWELSEKITGVSFKLK